MSKQKKILHFHPNGELANIFIKPLIDAERGAGHISNIVTSIKSVSIASTEIPYDLNLKNLLLLPFAICQIFNIFRRESPDIVVSHNSKSSTLVLACAWCARVPVRIYFNHGVPYIAYVRLLKFVLISLEKLNLLFSTKVLTVSLDMVNALRALNDAKSINIVHNGSASGIDLSGFVSVKHLHSTLKHENNIEDNDFLVVFVGRPVKRKGFHLVLKLWMQYFSDAKYKLILCGPTELNVVTHLGFLPNNVIPLGFTAQVPRILSASDIFILPSLHEGLSYAIIESMASKCLVIANDIPGIRSLVSNEHNGFLVKNNDVDKYAEIIKKIQSTLKSDLDLIRKNAFETAKMYSREDFLPAYLLHLH
jgi:glycosyltransferase involved in cell wall biosynthesis